MSFGKTVFSKHIVGGEIIYDFIGGNNYRVTLKVYRDCFSGGAPFDGVDLTVPPAYLSIYYGTGVLDTIINIGAPVITNIPPTINNPCIQAPGGICVEQGVYTYTINLPPKAGGYFLVYQRCCRNNTILNLVNPGGQGATYFTKIPGPEDVLVNSSPRFKEFPPLFVCNNLPFTFDHSATDPDGDQLVYSLCAPYLGLDATCPSLGTAGGCPTVAPPPPYINVNYIPPYSGGNPISANPAFSINPSTGILTGKPNLTGQFVVGVCIQEFRGPKLLNTHYRDFQFNVTPCIINVLSLFADQRQKCQGNTITFDNQSTSNLGGLTYFWDFGVNPLTTDTSSIKNPVYNYADTGRYVVTLIANPNKPCTDTLKQIVYVYPPLKANFVKQNRQCLKGNSFNFSNTSQSIPTATFKWNFTANATPSTSILKNPTGIVYNQAGKFFVKLVAKQLTCVDSITDSVRVLNRPTAKINNLPLSLCDPANVGFSNGSFSDLPLSYKWLFSNGKTSSAFEPTQIFSPAGIYGATLIATTASLCLDTSIASVQNITVNPSPTAGFSVSPKETTIFEPEINVTDMSGGNVTAWYYYLGDGSSSSYQSFIYPYTSTGVYTITQVVSNAYNCRDSTQQEVTILPEFRFWIPNTFTPNNDGKNDVFMPIAIGVLKYHFDIFDKWGQHIYSGNNYLEGWDGRFNGKPCEQDVYVWLIDFRNEVTERHEYHQGQVTLLKNDH